MERGDEKFFLMARGPPTIFLALDFLLLLV